MSLVHHREGIEAPLLALTFDDGPSPQTPEILDLLAEHDARATFFVLGESIEGREQILARVEQEGHEVGNHTYSHRHALDLDDAELAHEIVRCQRLLGGRPRLFRPPYGEDPVRGARIAAERGIPDTVLWSVDPQDFLERSPFAIAHVITSRARAGAIVDLHDGWPRVTTTVSDRTPTVEALRIALPQLASAGLRCVTVSELLSA